MSAWSHNEGLLFRYFNRIFRRDTDLMLEFVGEKKARRKEPSALPIFELAVFNRLGFQGRFRPPRIVYCEFIPTRPSSSVCASAITFRSLFRRMTIQPDAVADEIAKILG
jgi:hypothetical protein